MRLPQRRHVLRQDVPGPEFGERQARGLIRRGAPGDQLPLAVIEMLRELVDDLGLAAWARGATTTAACALRVPNVP